MGTVASLCTTFRGGGVMPFLKEDTGVGTLQGQFIPELVVSDNGMQQGGHLYGAVIPLQENDWDDPSTLVKDEVFEAPGLLLTQGQVVYAYRGGEFLTVADLLESFKKAVAAAKEEEGDGFQWQDYLDDVEVAVIGIPDTEDDEEEGEDPVLFDPDFFSAEVEELGEDYEELSEVDFSEDYVMMLFEMVSSVSRTQQALGDM